MPQDTHERYCCRPGCYVHAVHERAGKLYCDDHVPFEWTPARVDELLTLDSDGLSRGEIARRFGCTRNVIMGKLNRLGRVGNGSGRGNSKRREQAQINNRQRATNPGVATALAMARNPGNLAPMTSKAPLAAPKIAGASSQSLNLRIIDTGFGGCRWPTRGEGADTRFCCVPTGGETYCQAHAKRAFQGGKVISRDVARDVRRCA